MLIRPIQLIILQILRPILHIKIQPIIELTPTIAKPKHNQLD